MSFADLPDDILILILGPLISKEFNGWKKQLSLLSVNQNLRRLFFPQIYKHVFMADRLKGVLTNIDLIATTPRLANHLHINTTVVPNGYETLEAIANILSKHPELCSCITKLSLSIAHPKSFPFLSTSEIEHILAKTNSSAGSLVEMLPAINELTVCGRNSDRFSIALQKMLTQHYATQLSKLEYLWCFLSIDNLQLSQITHLNIRLNTLSKASLPLICLQTIQCMSIYELKPEDTWNIFSRDTGSSVVVPYLRELRLEYIYDRDSDDDAIVSMMQKHRLHLPQLQILKLEGYAKYFPLLIMAVLPENMDKISIAANGENFTTFSDVKLPAAKSVAYRVIWGIPKDNLSLFLCLNRLLQNALDCKSISLSINAYTTPNFVDRLCCPGLTSLRLNFKIDFDTMDAIIANHPRLIRLSLDLASGKPTGFDSRQRPTPLNTSIRELCIDYSGQLSHQPTVLKYLMLRLPALECIYGNRIKASILKQIASDNLSEYPHFANMRFMSDVWLF